MILKKKVFMVLPVLFLLLSACNLQQAAAPTTKPTKEPAATKVEKAAVHWTYDAGEEGPAHWGDLSPDFAACSTGKKQSPVDLTAADQKDLANIVFHYQPTNIDIINNGHAIQVKYDAGSYIEVDGVQYVLQQFHFHAPSEHSINGKLADAEVHFVHKSKDGVLAVVGILINKGAENAPLQSFWSKLPEKKGPAQTLEGQFNANDVLPPTQTTFRYDGSLTTPPCTEGVKWIVMTEPITMSEAQLAAYTKLFHEGTNRPEQDLNGRPEVEDTTP